jgi:hypothetical protein
LGLKKEEGMKKSHPKSAFVCGKDLWCMEGHKAKESTRGEPVVVLQAEPNGDGRLIVEYVLAKDFHEIAGRKHD